MTFLAERFQIAWVVGTAFAQLQNMMAVAVVVLGGLMAVLTNAAIPLENELLEQQPLAQRGPAVPRKLCTRNFFKFKKSHSKPRLTPPDLTQQQLTSSDRTSALPQDHPPQLAKHRHAVPDNTTPVHASFHLTVPNPTRPHPSLTTRSSSTARQASPYHTKTDQATPRQHQLSPCQNSPYQLSPCQNSPYQASALPQNHSPQLTKQHYTQPNLTT